MKKILLITTLIIFSTGLQAQLFKETKGPIVKDQNGEVMNLAFSGGLNQPQFSNVDINGDGSLDLLIFDRSGSKHLIFVSEKMGSEVTYKYAPEYEEFIPESNTLTLTRDFDADGDMDLFNFINDSLFLYRNESFKVSTNLLPSFEVEKPLIALDKVSPNATFPYKKLTSLGMCIPAIQDVDGDSDLDFISMLNFTGSTMILYHNNSVENSYPLDSINYDIVDKCYGGVSEDFDIYLNAECFFFERYKKKHFSTKTLLSFDNDGDGDMDLFIGNSEKLSNPVYFLENGKSDLNFYKDTFITIDTAYFSENVEQLMPIAPGMYSVDINLDGTLDLILSANDADKSSYPINEKDNVLFFLNTGADDNPNFEYQRNDFLVGDMIDLGSHSAPTFSDLDGDGDQDMVVATSGNHFENMGEADYLVYYENIGSATKPEFQLVDEDYLGIKSKDYQVIIPSFADLDDDGDMDLFLGRAQGEISYYLNIGTRINPSFDFQTDNYADIKVVSHAAPVFYDLNDDGKTDLLLGSDAGTVRYYKNEGTSSLPDFILADDSLGGIIVNELILQRILGSEGFRDTFIYKYEGYSVPTIVTWENGEVGLAVGSDEGLVKLYTIADDISTDFEEEEEYLQTSLTKTNFSKDWGTSTCLGAADLNGDKVSDIVVGNARGGLNFLEGIPGAKSNSISSIKLESFNVYPNPTNGIITVFANSNNLLDYKLFDLSGRILQEGTVRSRGSIQLDVLTSDGIYFLSLEDDSKLFAPQKIIVTR